MKFSEASLKAQVLASLAILASGVASVPLGAHVLRELWVWFVEPVTHLGPPTLLGAYGLTLFVSLFQPFMPRSVDEEATKRTDFAAVVTRGLIARPGGYLILWGLGALVHALEGT